MSTAMHAPRVRLLWSGGMDSTFLLLTLLKAGQRVEPVYIVQDVRWQKQRRELEARRRIVHALPDSMRSLLVLPGREVDDVPEDRPAEEWATFWRLSWEAYEACGPKNWMSYQSCMLAAVARESGPIAAAFVAGDHAPTHRVARRLLDGHGVQMPLLARSKEWCIAEAQRQGFAHLLRLTWSCEGSNRDAAAGPCGLCDPCKARRLPFDPVLVKGAV